MRFDCGSPAFRKPLRAFASGRLPLFYGLAMAPSLAILSGVLAGLLSPILLGIVLIYFTLAAAYSLYLRKPVLLDVMLLGSFYTLRISYELSDAELLGSMGLASGYSAVLVLSLYIASGAVKVLYTTHQVLWVTCPLMVNWIAYLWLIAHRGEMQHDPIVFALRNRTSRILILLMLTAALIAI